MPGHREQSINTTKGEDTLDSGNNIITMRKPTTRDGSSIYNLIQSSPPLDLNSLYCYLLICLHFGDTSVIAENDNGIAGFISAYIPPARSDTLFIWQVAVHEHARNSGLATAMIGHILARPETGSIAFIETTVTPSNAASESLFRHVAKKHNTSCRTSTCFPAMLFGAGSHEEEVLFRIGPLKNFNYSNPQEDV
jgi:L-2,4-diaminobutyric acid acetyltransferase